MNPPVNRRDFLETCATAGGLVLAGGLAAQPLLAAEQAGWPKLPTVKIHVVYIGLGGAWPKPDFDAKAEVAKFQKLLDGARQALGDVEFVGGQLIPNNEAAAVALLPKLAGADALLIVHLAFGSGGPFLKLIDSGLPTVIFSQPFSGHDWMYVPQWQKAGKKVVLLASSDYADLQRAAALLRVPARMRQTKIIYVGGPHGTPAARSAVKVKAKFGAELISVSVPDVIAAHDAVSPKAAEAEAEEYWLKPAKKIVEPSREEIIKSARMFLAMKNLMIDRNARAITIHCLGGIPIDKLGYPCLGFSKLNDLGLVGACEADMDSTLTMLMFGYAFVKPGFITDPLFDLAKNAVVHAHCLSATKMDGPTGQRAPFVIRTHRDDSRGASLAVELRIGQDITCAKLCNLDAMLLSAQKISEIPSFDDRGCRTQIVARVSDARKMLSNWGSGVLDKTDMMTMLHRVVFYGNHVENVEHLAQLMGLKVVMEG
jgi:hypothetical protein